MHVTKRDFIAGAISFIVLLTYFPWSLFAILNPMTACVRLFLNPGKKGFCSEKQSKRADLAPLLPRPP